MIESKEPLTDEERKKIEFQGEYGIPQKLLNKVKIIYEGGLYPDYVSIDED